MINKNDLMLILLFFIQPQYTKPLSFLNYQFISLIFNFYYILLNILHSFLLTIPKHPSFKLQMYDPIMNITNLYI